MRKPLALDEDTMEMISMIQRTFFFLHQKRNIFSFSWHHKYLTLNTWSKLETYSTFPYSLKTEKCWIISMTSHTHLMTSSEYRYVISSSKKSCLFNIYMSLWKRGKPDCSLIAYFKWRIFAWLHDVRLN